ncbi:hypothetical protein JOB18_034105 [Solea senegalensis]|uniref:Uncharacterized protein n=1 Tax=Solea senegalensis TaxID=28829 RepID=A0AAV6SII2_SOLSE|nr:hypothetical protein JOB18_034105 [Solea senegalensis]
MNADQLFTEQLKVRGEAPRDVAAPKNSHFLANDGDNDGTRTGGQTEVKLQKFRQSFEASK